MEKYKWNKEEIELGMSNINKVLKEVTNPVSIELVTEVYDVYKEMLEIIDLKGNKEDTLPAQKYYEPKQLISNFTRGISRLDYNLADFLVNTYSVVRSTKPPIEVLNVKCSNDLLVENSEKILKDFIDKKMYSNYLEFKEENPNFLYLREGTYNNCDGCLFVDRVLKKKYIVVHRNNDATDLATLPHELFHLVFNDYDYDYLADPKSQLYYITEIEGSFADFLAADFYKEKDKEISKNIINLSFATYLEQIFSLVVGISYSNAITINGKFKKDKFDKILREFNDKQKLDLDDIQFWLNGNAYELINYGLSYLASIDLYSIYKEDKEKALYILKNIKLLKTKEEIIPVLRKNNMTFMDDGCENLKQLTKKIKDQTL